MSENLAKAYAGKSNQPKRDKLPAGEEKALAKIKSEAEDNEATLLSDGEGGLPPSLVLGVFRRDKWACKVCGSKTDLGVHHKGGDVRSKWLSKKGHSNEPNNLVTICPDCHDDVHDKAREDGTDSSQVTPDGDKNDGSGG